MTAQRKGPEARQRFEAQIEIPNQEISVSIDTTTPLSAPDSGSNPETYDIPVLGYLSPAAELRLLAAGMDRVLSPIKDLLLRIGVTFDQALAIYNDIPLLMTAEDFEEAEMLALIAKHVEVV